MAIPQVTSSQGAPRLPFLVETMEIQNHLMMLTPYLKTLDMSMGFRAGLSYGDVARMSPSYTAIDIDRTLHVSYGQIWYEDPQRIGLEIKPISYLINILEISEDGI